MKRSYTGRGLILGLVLLVLVASAILLLVPVVNKDPGFPRQPRVMAAIIVAMKEYHNCYGSFPHGSSEDVLKGLQGGNPRKILFLDPGDDIAQDDWNTPFRVTTDEQTISVASAGPDRRWDTEDDIKKIGATAVGGMRP